MRFKLTILLLLLTCKVSCGYTSSRVPSGGYRNVAYYVNWAIGRNFFPQDLPADKLTHVLYAFANIRPDGVVFLSDEYVDTDKHFEGESAASDAGNNIYGCLQQLYILKKKHRHLKVLLSIGGWSYRDNFAVPAATPRGRSRFASSVVSLVRNLGLDGVDIDWEYPMGDSQANNFVQLLCEVRTALDAYSNSLSVSYPFLLTVAAPAGPQGVFVEGLHLAKMDQYIDFWNLMAYDYSTLNTATHRANLFHDYDNPKSTPFNTKTAVDYYVSRGIKSDKIVLGMPIYGHAFNQTDGLGLPSTNAIAGTWEPASYDFKVLPLPGSKEYYNSTLGISYSYDDNKRELISYDNIAVVKQKAAWIQTMGLGGAMWWESSADGKGSDSLIETVSRVLVEDGSRLDDTVNQLAYPDSIYANLQAGMPDSKSLPGSVVTTSVTTATSSFITSSPTGTSSVALASPFPFNAYSKLGCTGRASINYDISALLGMNQTTDPPGPPKNFSSFNIGRPLQGREQLDFSTGIDPDWCGLFLRSYWPQNSPEGCVNIDKFRCVRLWLN